MQITNIQHFCLDDGPGIRTTVFMAGCNMRCLWCHNPEAIVERVFPHSVREISTDELFTEICEDEFFFNNSSGGVTFSGGEPILQSKELLDVLRKCKGRNIHVAVETAANYAIEILEPVLEYIDLLIVDCKAVTDEVFQKCTGKSNAHFLENIRMLSNRKKRMWVRIPVVWGVNISVQEMTCIGQFLKPLCVEKVELLPYHKMGVHKYEKYGLKYLLYDIEPPTEEQLQICRNVLCECGISVLKK